MRILVTGATGLVGTAVVQNLLGTGKTVRALVRSPRTWDGVETIVGTMADPENLVRACSGCDAVVHLAACKNDEAESFEVNVMGAKNLREAAEHAGVKCIVHLSTQSVLLPKRGTYGETKRLAEEALNGSAIPVTHLRASIVYAEVPDGIVGSILGFSSLPLFPVIGSGNVHFRPIHRDDLANGIAAVLERKELWGRTYDVGGCDAYSFNELIDVLLCAKHLRRLKVHIPIVLARFIALLPFSPITKSNVLGSMQDVPFDPDPFLSATGIQPRKFSEAMKTWLCSESEDKDEAKALLEYVLPGSASEVLIERYLQALRAHGVPSSPQLTRALMRKHRSLQGLEWSLKMRNPQARLLKKMLIAAAIREADPQSAEELLPKSRTKHGVALELLKIGFAALAALPSMVLWQCRPSRKHYATV